MVCCEQNIMIVLWHSPVLLFKKLFFAGAIFYQLDIILDRPGISFYGDPLIGSVNSWYVFGAENKWCKAVAIIAYVCVMP